MSTEVLSAGATENTPLTTQGKGTFCGMVLLLKQGKRSHHVIENEGPGNMKVPESHDVTENKDS
jgi:hypothetical protein